MKYLFVLAFIAVFFLFDTSIGYANKSPIYTHFTYMFQHASLIHLAINSISFIALFSLLEKYVNKKTFVPISFLIGFAMSFLAMYNIPTVGVSSVLYAMIGAYIGVITFYMNIKIADTRRYLLNISIILVSLLVSYLKSNSNFSLHTYSMISGIIFSLFLSVKNNRNQKNL